MNFTNTTTKGRTWNPSLRRLKRNSATLKSKNPTAQMNELLSKRIAYNLTVLIHEMYELSNGSPLNGFKINEIDG